MRECYEIRTKTISTLKQRNEICVTFFIIHCCDEIKVLSYLNIYLMYAGTYLKKLNNIIIRYKYKPIEKIEIVDLLLLATYSCGFNMEAF